ncbi:hypothetical protein B0T11DRAFT_28859 [Plectosphaerella cucumerina]|uniref:Uncharacterized protein n=1 Tax=Plectosphaerella cucumerina TaxID=40658 RepID=A0A8K0XAI2_9PEZI|nr:hypothetical protein B0T11DRAFT_28859 [Plectosphaerella cucumerina]
MEVTPARQPRDRRQISASVSAAGRFLWLAALRTWTFADGLGNQAHRPSRLECFCDCPHGAELMSTRRPGRSQLQTQASADSDELTVRKRWVQ